MQLLTNLFVLAQQLSPTAGLRVIGNGLGLPVYGAEENVVDYALLSVDTKAALPSQVQAICWFWYFSVQFTICSSATADAFLTNILFFQLLRQSGNPWITLHLHPQSGKEDPIFKLTVMWLPPNGWKGGFGISKFFRRRKKQFFYASPYPPFTFFLPHFCTEKELPFCFSTNGNNPAFFLSKFSAGICFGERLVREGFKNPSPLKGPLNVKCPPIMFYRLIH